LIVLAIAGGSVLAFVLSVGAGTFGRAAPVSSSERAVIATSLLRIFALGIPAGAALGGVGHDSPYAVVGVALVTFIATYCLYEAATGCTHRRHGRVFGLVVRALLGFAAAGLGVALGTVLV
jgi:hypothetical protein